MTSDGQQVGRELDPAPRAVDGPGDGLGQRRLADAGDVLDEEVPLGEQAHQREVHLVRLPWITCSTLSSRALEERARPACAAWYAVCGDQRR